MLHTWGTFLLGFHQNVLQNDGKFVQARPIKHKFCKDFVWTTPAIGGGGRCDRAACRDMKQTYREVARETHKQIAFASRTRRQPTPKRAAQHLAGATVSPRCNSMYHSVPKHKDDLDTRLNHSGNFLLFFYRFFASFLGSSSGVVELVFLLIALVAINSCVSQSQCSVTARR